MNPDSADDRDRARRRAEFIRAATEGRNASIGAPNPYYGQGLLAQLWRTGYSAMLREAVNNTGAMRQYHELSGVEPATSPGEVMGEWGYSAAGGSCVRSQRRSSWRLARSHARH